MKHLLILALLLLSPGLSAQEKRISKFVVKKGETYKVGSDNTLYVDTLILEDKATILFAPGRMGILDTKVAFVGKKCTISASGLNGANSREYTPGLDGESAGSLSLVMHFEQLGSLSIDTRGGKGGNGANGKPGKPGSADYYVTKVSRDASGKTVTTTEIVPGELGTDGTNATMGGNGGNGGNIMLMYSSSGFIINFNRDEHENNINIFYTAGERGKSGTPGKGGYMSSNGVLIPSEYKPVNNGRVMLVNLNQPQLSSDIPSNLPAPTPSHEY